MSTADPGSEPIGPSPQQRQKASPLFLELNKYLAVRDYRQVLKVTNKLFHTDGFRTNYKLAKCKCSALIKMSRYEEVVKFVDGLIAGLSSSGAAGQELVQKLAYEKAYSLYRLFKNDKALAALNNSKVDTEQEMSKNNELRAQILYRLERFQEAKDLYKSLLRTLADDDFAEDRENNLLACEASMALKNRVFKDELSLESQAKVKMTKLGAATPDAFFNRAIIHIGNGDYNKAVKSLTTAKNELESYDDLEPDELENDLQPILMQLALIKQMTGENDASLKIYQEILKSVGIQSAASGGGGLLETSIMNNNILAINQTHNLFDSKKRIKALQTKTSI